MDFAEFKSWLAKCPISMRQVLGLRNELDSIGGGPGTTDHAALTHLGYADAGHTGFEPSLGFTAVPNSRTVAGHALTGDVTISKSDVGLANAEDTTDANKPVSTATQTALDGKVSHSLATVINDFLVASGVGVFVKKTLSETKTILGLGSAAYTASTDYAVSAKGVTNGDSHDHNGGDGAQIVYSTLGSIPSTFAPTNHAGAHVTGGSDIIANAIAAGNAGLMSGTDKTKLDGIAAGAEVNVNADWNAVSGDAQILNKPAIPTQYTDEMAQDAVGGMADRSIIYDDATPYLRLSGDLASPGNNKVYGTDGTGVKGWKADPAGGPGGSGADVVGGRLTYVSTTSLKWAFANSNQVRLYDNANGIDTIVACSSEPTLSSTANDMNGDAIAYATVYDLFAVFGSSTSMTLVVAKQAVSTAGASARTAAWAGSTAYKIGQRVSNGGSYYPCLIAHTSGTFATDLAAGKWGPAMTGTGDLLGLDILDGYPVYSNTGAWRGYRWLGVIITYNDTGSKFRNTAQDSSIGNYYNRMPVSLKAYNSTANWTDTYGGTRECNNGAGMIYANFISATSQSFMGSVLGNVSTSSAAIFGFISYAIDGTVSQFFISNNSVSNLDQRAAAPVTIGPGNHYVTLSEYSTGSTSTMLGGLTHNGADSLLLL